VSALFRRFFALILICLMMVGVLSLSTAQTLSSLPAYTPDQAATLAREASLQGASLLKFRTCRGQLRVGVVQTCRVFVMGDSKTYGAGAGTGSQFTNGAFPFSRPSRLASIMAQGGIPVRTNSWFGTGGMSSIAAVTAYDTRRSGFTGWGGGEISLGGPALATANTNPGTFQPTVPVDRVSIFYVQRPGEGIFSVTKGSETFSINSQSATRAFVRSEIVFTIKDASPISITWTSGGYIDIIGESAWDSAVPGVEISNVSVYGVTSTYQADATNPWSPINAIGAYAPHLTIFNLWTNDLNTGAPLATAQANMQALITKAKLTGDCILEWPSIGGTSPSYGSDATRATWKATLATLATVNGCGFIDDELLLGGRTGAAAGALTADGVHEKAEAYDIEAQALSRYIFQ
jgi:hypothetical protein